MATDTLKSGSGNNLLLSNDDASAKLEVKEDGTNEITGNLRLGSTDQTAEATADDLIIEGTGSQGITIFTGTGNAGRLNFGDSGDADIGQIKYEHSTNYMSFTVNAGEKMRILAAGGLTFNGDTAAANALDDYEEGTWTAGFSNYSERTGYYTKIGRLVFCSAWITTTSGGSAGVTLTGIPFTSHSATASRGGGVAMFQNTSPSDTLTVFVNENNTNWSMRLGENDINMAASKTAYVSFTYITA